MSAVGGFISSSSSYGNLTRCLSRAGFGSTPAKSSTAARYLTDLRIVSRFLPASDSVSNIGKAATISGFTVLASVLAFGALFGLIGAIIGVPIAAALQIVVEELTAGRRARIAAADAAERTQ